MTKWSRVVELAELQHMVVAAWQLVALGVSEGAIADRVRHHGWRRWSRGVYLLPGPITPTRRHAAGLLAYSRPVNARQRVQALLEQNEASDHVEALVHVALRSGVVVCGLSAAWLHGLTTPPNHVWLRVSTHSGSAPRRLVRLCHGTYGGSVCWLDGLPVVDPEQALIDIAGMTDDTAVQKHHRLTRLIATADALRCSGVEPVQARVEASPNFRGRTALLRACDDLRGELSHSAPEQAARRIVKEVLREFGLDVEPRPHPVLLDGVIVGEADLAVLVLLLDIEVDGPHHLLPAQRAKDDARDRLLRRAGWTVERFTTQLIETSPNVFAARVRDTVRHLLGRKS